MSVPWIILLIIPGTTLEYVVQVKEKPNITGFSGCELVINFFIKWVQTFSTVTISSRMEPYTVAYVKRIDNVCIKTVEDDRFVANVACEDNSMNGSLVLQNLEEKDHNRVITFELLIDNDKENTITDKTTIHVKARILNNVVQVTEKPYVTGLSGCELVINFFIKWEQTFSTVTISSRMEPYTVAYVKRIDNVCIKTVEDDRFVANVACEDNSMNGSLVLQNVEKKDHNRVITFELLIDNDKENTVTEKTTIHVIIQNLSICSDDVTILEGNVKAITCVISTSYPPANIAWLKICHISNITESIEKNISSKVLETGITMSTLQLTAQRKDDGCSIYCEATSGSGNSKPFSKRIHITVHYGPNDMRIYPPKKQITIIENETLNISCNADCNPKCVFSWETESAIVSNTSQLIIEKISRNENGNYTCQAFYERLNQTKRESSDVVIFYSPNVAVIGQNIITRNESESVTLQCEVDSAPLPDITWSKNNSEIFTRRKHPGISYFSIENVSCLDTGNYSCSAYNEIGSNGSESTELFVNCKPRFQDVGQKLKKGMYVKPGEELIVEIKYIAFPPPNVTWYFQPDEDLTSENPVPKKYMSTEDHTWWHKSKLMFPNMKAELFGSYTIKVKNSLGVNSLQIIVTEKVTDPVIESDGLMYLLIIVIVPCVVFCVIILIKENKCKEKQEQSMAESPQQTTTSHGVPNGYDGSYRDNVLYVPFELSKKDQSVENSIPTTKSLCDHTDELEELHGKSIEKKDRINLVPFQQNSQPGTSKEMCGKNTTIVPKHIYVNIVQMHKDQNKQTTDNQTVCKSNYKPIPMPRKTKKVLKITETKKTVYSVREKEFDMELTNVNKNEYINRHKIYVKSILSAKTNASFGNEAMINLKTEAENKSDEDDASNDHAGYKNEEHETDNDDDDDDQDDTHAENDGEGNDDDDDDDDDDDEEYGEHEDDENEDDENEDDEEGGGGHSDGSSNDGAEHKEKPRFPNKICSLEEIDTKKLKYNAQHGHHNRSLNYIDIALQKESNLIHGSASKTKYSDIYFHANGQNNDSFI